MVEMNSRKAAIIGCGFVGSASAFSLMESHLFSEIVLIDADKDRAEGEALDISHGLPFSKPMQIYAGTYQDISDAAVVIVTAGAGQKPGETRLDLVKKNVAIFKSIIPEVAKYNRSGILLIVALNKFEYRQNFVSATYRTRSDVTLKAVNFTFRSQHPTHIHPFAVSHRLGAAERALVLLQHAMDEQAYRYVVYTDTSH